MNPRDLPIYQIEHTLRETLKRHQVAVVESPPGSGKTTQIPQILLNAGYAELGLIGVTQPRRIAAVSVSHRIAAEIGCAPGDLVGYKMRFADETGPRTKIKVMTDGILLQELRASPQLQGYSVLMVDEAHERSLNIDFILGLLREILRERDDLRVLVSSATMNAAAFGRYFNDAPVLTLDAKPYRVDVEYRSLPDQAQLRGRSRKRPQELLVDETVAAVKHLLDLDRGTGAGGDLLVFLPGEAAILACAERVRALSSAENAVVLPLFGRLSKEEQDRVFDSFGGRRKVVIATNIAETSITIDGVTGVVDCGLAKVKTFDHTTGIGSLQEELVSRASSDQRLGRAGRTAPGRCVRLYSAKSYRERPPYAREEILRSDLSEVVLRMIALGIQSPESFVFLTRPDPKAIRGALAQLITLGAITPDRRLTSVGDEMADLPLEPRIGRMVVEARRNAPEVMADVATLAGFLSGRGPYRTEEGAESEARRAHRALHDRRGDLHSYLNIFRRFMRSASREEFCRQHYLDHKVLAEVANIREQIMSLARERGFRRANGRGSTEALLRTVMTGLVQFICRRTSRAGGYRSTTEQGILLHPGSALFREPPECIVAAEIVRTKRTFARSTARLDPEWVRSGAPEVFRALFQEGRRAPKRERPAKTPPAEPPESVPIAGVQFPVVQVRRRPLVVLRFKDLLRAVGAGRDGERSADRPGERLRAGFAAALEELCAGEARDMRGVIELPEGHLMRGAPLARILLVGPWLSLSKGAPVRFPKDAFYTLPEHLVPLKRHLPDLLRTVSLGGKRRTLGLLTLVGNGAGGYWLEGTTDFIDAVTTSVVSLEDLAEQVEKLPIYEDLSEVKSALARLRAIEEALQGGVDRGRIER